MCSTSGLMTYQKEPHCQAALHNMSYLMSYRKSGTQPWRKLLSIRVNDNNIAAGAGDEDGEIDCMHHQAYDLGKATQYRCSRTASCTPGTASSEKRTISERQPCMAATPYLYNALSPSSVSYRCKLCQTREGILSGLFTPAGSCALTATFSVIG